MQCLNSEVEMWPNMSFLGLKIPPVLTGTRKKMWEGGDRDQRNLQPKLLLIPKNVYWWISEGLLSQWPEAYIFCDGWSEAKANSKVHFKNSGETWQEKHGATNQQEICDPPNAQNSLVASRQVHDYPHPLPNNPHEKQEERKHENYYKLTCLTRRSITVQRSLCKYIMASS